MAPDPRSTQPLKLRNKRCSHTLYPQAHFLVLFKKFRFQFRVAQHFCSNPGTESSAGRDLGSQDTHKLRLNGGLDTGLAGHCGIKLATKTSREEFDQKEVVIGHIYPVSVSKTLASQRALSQAMKQATHVTGISPWRGQNFIRKLLTYMKCTDTLAVQPEILRERLCHSHLHRRAAREVTDSPGVVVEIAGSEPLAVSKQISKDRPRTTWLREKDPLSRVEEREKLLPFTDVCNGDPLLPGRVEARRVVSTSLQDDNVSRLRFLFQ